MNQKLRALFAGASLLGLLAPAAQSADASHMLETNTLKADTASPIFKVPIYIATPARLSKIEQLIQTEVTESKNKYGTNRVNRLPQNFFNQKAQFKVIDQYVLGMAEAQGVTSFNKKDSANITKTLHKHSSPQGKKHMGVGADAATYRQPPYMHAHNLGASFTPSFFCYMSKLNGKASFQDHARKAFGVSSRQLEHFDDNIDPYYLKKYEELTNQHEKFHCDGAGEEQADALAAIHLLRQGVQNRGVVELRRDLRLVSAVLLHNEEDAMHADIKGSKFSERYGYKVTNSLDHVLSLSEEEINDPAIFKKILFTKFDNKEQAMDKLVADVISSDESTYSGRDLQKLQDMMSLWQADKHFPDASEEQLISKNMLNALERLKTPSVSYGFFETPTAAVNFVKPAFPAR